MPLRCPSSSPQNPLRWAFVGAPIGCAEKRKRFLMVSREKGLGGGIPGFARNARGAFYGGFGLAIADGSDHSTTYAVSLVGGIQGYPLLLFSLPHPGCWGEIGGRGASGYSLLLFCCRSPVVAGGWRWGASGCSLLLFLLPQSGGCGRLEMWAERFRECRGAAAKRGRRCIRAGPGIPLMSRADTGGTAHKSTPGQNPRTRRRERSGRSPECRRLSLFLLHHQKAHSLFGATDRGPHKSPAKRVLWGRGKRRSAASGGKSEPVSRKRRDWRTRRGRKSQCRDGVQGGNGAV